MCMIYKAPGGFACTTVPQTKPTLLFVVGIVLLSLSSLCCCCNTSQMHEFHYVFVCWGGGHLYCSAQLSICLTWKSAIEINSLLLLLLLSEINHYVCHTHLTRSHNHISTKPPTHHSTIPTAFIWLCGLCTWDFQNATLSTKCGFTRWRRHTQPK